MVDRPTKMVATPPSSDVSSARRRRPYASLSSSCQLAMSDSSSLARLCSVMMMIPLVLMIGLLHPQLHQMSQDQWPSSSTRLLIVDALIIPTPTTTTTSKFMTRRQQLQGDRRDTYHVFPSSKRNSKLSSSSFNDEGGDTTTTTSTNNNSMYSFDTNTNSSNGATTTSDVGTTTSTATATSADGNSGSDADDAFAAVAEVNTDGDDERTLYDILGANPSDTPRQLKMRYISLQKQLHPDARIGNSNANGGMDDEYYDNYLREVNSAYEVLSNPKLKLRYDRILQGKQFTNEFVKNVVEQNLRNNVIPFIKKTADTTASVVSTTTGFASQVSKSFSKLEKQQKLSNLQQRIDNSKKRVKAIKEEISNLSQTRLSILQTSTTSGSATTDSTAGRGFGKRNAMEQDYVNGNNFFEAQQGEKTQLTSAEALQIGKRFNINGSTTSSSRNKANSNNVILPIELSNGIDTLREYEREQYDMINKYNEMERQLQVMENRINMAQQKELQAKNAVEEAKRQLEIAKDALTESIQQRLNIQKEYNTIQQKKDFTLSERMNTINRDMNALQNSIKQELYNEETRYIERRRMILSHECIELERSIQQYIEDYQTIESYE